MKIDQIPVSNLVDAVFDTFLLVDKENEYTAEELKKLLGDLPDSQAKTTLLKLVDEGVTDLNALRKKTSLWFTGLMDQAGDYYKAHARRWVIIISLVVTLLFGVDSFQFSGTLWHNAEMRAAANAMATYYAKQEANSTQIDKLAADLSTFNFQIGWWSSPAGMPKDGMASAWAVWVLLKILGLGITGLAVSQGSSFWYDALRHLKGESTTPPKPATQEGQVPAAG